MTSTLVVAAPVTMCGLTSDTSLTTTITLTSLNVSKPGAETVTV